MHHFCKNVNREDGLFTNAALEELQKCTNVLAFFDTKSSFNCTKERKSKHAFGFS